jgi:hypothetical protein
MAAWGSGAASLSSSTNSPLAHGLLRGADAAGGRRLRSRRSHRHGVGNLERRQRERCWDAGASKRGLLQPLRERVLAGLDFYFAEPARRAVPGLPPARQQPALPLRLLALWWLAHHRSAECRVVSPHGRHLRRAGRRCMEGERRAHLRLAQRRLQHQHFASERLRQCACGLLRGFQRLAARPIYPLCRAKAGHGADRALRLGLPPRAARRL